MGILKAARNMRIEHNVTFRVLDAESGNLVKEYTGHNQATNSMIIGIAHYLAGDGILNQGSSMLSTFVPKYISLGTMGLTNQEEDAEGLPAGVGIGDTEKERFEAYMNQQPGYGADGYDVNKNNGRRYLGLGPVFGTFNNHAVDCELISSAFPRSPITYRQIVPETESELPETIDVIFSAMVSTGALKQFRETGKDYIFITEAGLWSKMTYNEKNPNGFLAGYRLIPPDKENWDMSIAENRRILKQNIIRVNKNQVVQVIWKIQIGAMERFGALAAKPVHCDCICEERSNPNPECPCHGNKEKKTTLHLDKHIIELHVEESESIIAVVDPAQDVEWYSSDESVAKYENGYVKAYSDGTAIITAKATDGSGAQDSCIIKTHVNVPVGELESYTIFSVSALILGARTIVYGENIGIGKSIEWQASDYGINEGRIVGYSDNSKLYVWGDNTSVGDDSAIVSYGGNYFDIAVYMSENASVSLLNQPNADEAFLKGIYDIPQDMKRPEIKRLDSSDYITGENDVIIGQNELALMFEETVVILNKSSGSSYTDKYGNVYSDYEYSKTVESSNKEYGAYRRISFDSSASRRAKLYVYPGKYAISSISQTGNHTELRFKNSTQGNSTVFYVSGNISLTNDTHISNDGAARSCMVYCTGNLSAGAVEEMNLYLVAPDGKVTISNSNESNPVILYGNIYANEIELGNNVHLEIREA